MPKILVLFHSRTGNTAALADAIADGAGSVKFAEVEVRRIADLAAPSAIEGDEQKRSAPAMLAKKYRTLESIDALVDYDALVIGSPTRWGTASAEVKQLLEQTAPLVQRGALVDKVGSAFGTVAAPHGGLETTIQSLLVPMMHLGMLIVPPAYTNPGAGASEAELARRQGARVAKVAEWVRHAKSHEGHGHKH